MQKPELIDAEAALQAGADNLQGMNLPM